MIIVGAGPAGATAAYCIASAGHKVLLLDQQKFPREKKCGDFVSPGSIKELQKMGITDLPEFKGTNVVDHATIHLSGEELVSGAFPVFPDLVSYGRVVPRVVLDRLIVDAARKAGATILEDMRVRDFHAANDAVTVVAQDLKSTRNFRARLLIGADGNESTIAQILRGSPWPIEHKAIAAQGYFQNISGSPNHADVFYNDESFPGYSWIFPVNKSEANVGVGVILDVVPVTENPKKILKHLISTDPGMHSRLEHATLKGKLKVSFLNLYDPQFSIVANRVMLIGEAAGLVNPFNGEGIQFALLSGRWASEAAVSCMANNDFSVQALGAYSKQVEAELGEGFKVSALMFNLVHNRSLNSGWLQALRAMGEKSKTDPEYASLTSGILSGMIFPNRDITAKISVGATQEATIATGIQTINEALNDPTRLPQSALKMTQVGIEVAQQAAQDPLGFLTWGMSAVTKAAELAGAVAKQVIKKEDENNST